MPSGQPDAGSFLIEIPFSKVTLVCVQLTKSNQHNTFLKNKTKPKIISTVLNKHSLHCQVRNKYMWNLQCKSLSK